MNRTWFDRAYGDQLPATLPAVPDERLRALWECDDDMTAKTTEAASALTTFSTRGSLGIPLMVGQSGGKWYVFYKGGSSGFFGGGRPTSGAYVEPMVPYATRDEALAAAKRLAGEEGVRVEEECAEVDESLGSLLEDPDFDKLVALHRAGEAHTQIGQQVRQILARKHGMTLDAVWAHADSQSGGVLHEAVDPATLERLRADIAKWEQWVEDRRRSQGDQRDDKTPIKSWLDRVQMVDGMKADLKRLEGVNVKEGIPRHLSHTLNVGDKLNWRGQIVEVWSVLATGTEVGAPIYLDIKLPSGKIESVGLDEVTRVT